jgi:uncharacterized paraquat-inducible protein A
MNIEERLEEIRVELRAERISYSELHELQELREFIDCNDIELLEALGEEEMRTYITEDGHTNADCPKCEGSEHIDILEEDGQCLLCSVEEYRAENDKFSVEWEDNHGETK